MKLFAFSQQYVQSRGLQKTPIYSASRFVKLIADMDVGRITEKHLSEFRTKALAAGLSPHTVKGSLKDLRTLIRSTGRQIKVERVKVPQPDPHPVPHSHIDLIWPCLSLWAQQVFQDESIGPGEVSVAIAILQAARPDFNDQLILQDLSKVTQGSYQEFDVRRSSLLYKMVKHEGSSTVDIYDIINNKYYEVKQASDKKSVMVGKESRGPALQLYNRVKNDFQSLYASYTKLSSEHKNLI